MLRQEPKDPRWAQWRPNRGAAWSASLSLLAQGPIGASPPTQVTLEVTARSLEEAALEPARGLLPSAARGVTPGRCPDRLKAHGMDANGSQNPRAARRGRRSGGDGPFDLSPAPQPRAFPAARAYVLDNPLARRQAATIVSPLDSPPGFTCSTSASGRAPLHPLVVKAGREGEVFALGVQQEMLELGIPGASVCPDKRKDGE